MRIFLFKLWISLRFLLFPFSVLFWLFVLVRNFLYEKNFFKIKKLPRPVISIGNITAGGSGKTPMVEWLAKFFTNRGRKVAILSRGYGRKTKGFVLVSDGEKILVDAETCGDEPLQMAMRSVEENLGWIIAVCEDRYEAGLRVIERFDVDVFLLDDGFQRRDIFRDFDIVVVSCGTWNEFLIPAGLKREPNASVKRASAIIFSGDCEDELKRFKALLSGENVILGSFEYKLLEIRKFFDYILVKKPYERFKVVAFSGIGNHKGFIKTLKDNGFQILADIEFPDHHRYRASDIAKIVKSLESTGADFALTTHKDYARLFGFKELKNYPFFYSLIELEFKFGWEDLKQRLQVLC